jgi:hypothetical protein
LGVFENRVLRRIFGPERGEWQQKKITCEELRNLYYLPIVVRVIWTRRIGIAGHEGDEKCIQNFNLEIEKEGITLQT